MSPPNFVFAFQNHCGQACQTWSTHKEPGGFSPRPETKWPLHLRSNSSEYRKLVKCRLSFAGRQKNPESFWPKAFVHLCPVLQIRTLANQPADRTGPH